MIPDKLPGFLQEKYDLLKHDIQKRLEEYSHVPEDKYFYEFCFCLMTPQSRAKNAYEVQRILEDKDFLNNPFDPTPYLRAPEHYIRFHNQKASRLLNAREYFHKIIEILKSNITPEQKRLLIKDKVNGFGMKESAHFLRNIGYRNLGILDRHILKHLVYCEVLHELPKIGNIKQYEVVENKFLTFAEKTGIPMDELDLLFWSYETSEIFK